MHNLDTDILSKEEYEMLQNFTNEHRKGEFMTARYLFWKLVDVQGWNSNSVTLKKEKHGKPFIESEEDRFFVSFSHSQDLVMCAISQDLDIGLDTETLNREVNPEVVRRILSEKEWKVYGEDDAISLWTMKEAAVKSLGTGLRTNLKELELEKLESGHFSVTINQKKELRGICFTALNHYIALAY
ncbi:MAG: hypothetical protein BalsKO_10980 [Balneolaceae bacterium]